MSTVGQTIQNLAAHPAQSYLVNLLSQGDPAKTACCWQGREISYATLHNKVHSLAEQLQEFFQPGELIGIYLPNCPELIEICLAAFRNTMTAMPLNAETSRPELLTICQRAGLNTVLTNAALAADLAQSDLLTAGIERLLLIDEDEGIRLGPEGASISIARPDRGSNSGPTSGPHSGIRSEPDSGRQQAQVAAALVIHTSGSSGFPKGVVISPMALQEIIEGRIASARIMPESHAIVASCLSHSVGLYQALAYLHVGASFVLLESYAVDQLVKQLNSRHPSHLIMVVSAFQALLLHPELATASLRSLQFASVGADRVPMELQQRYFALTGRLLTVTYGMTELSWIMVNDLQDPARSCALGKPAAGVEVCLLDPAGEPVAAGQSGQIVARSPKSMSGYLCADGSWPVGSRSAWIYSGDLARQDEDGVYWFEGRIKDLIVLSTGDVVAPVEIEQAALQLDGVDDCIALGVEVLQPGLGNLATEPWLLITSASSKLTETAIVEQLRSILSAHKVPTKVLFPGKVPVSITGKISRQQLAEYLQQHAKE